MKRTVFLFLSGLVTLSLFQPVSALTSGSGESDDQSAMPCPLLLTGGVVSQVNLAGLLPPWSKTQAVFPVPVSTEAVTRHAVDLMQFDRFWSPPVSGLAAAVPEVYVEIGSHGAWAVPDLESPDAPFPEQIRIVQPFDSGNVVAAPAAVTVPEPMGRTLLALGMAGLLVRGILRRRGSAQTKPFFRFQGFWWAMTRS